MNHKLILVLASTLLTASSGFAQGNTPTKSSPQNPSRPARTQSADNAIRKVDFRNFTYRLISSELPTTSPGPRGPWVNFHNCLHSISMPR